MKRYIQFIRDSGLTELIESIGPIKTPYGVDLTDNKWADAVDIKKEKKPSSGKGELIFTFTKIDDYYYQIYILNNSTWNEIGFATSNKFDYKNPLSEGNLNRFNRNRTNDSRIYKVFNRVFYITLMGLSEYKIDNLAFRGSDPYLGALYTKMMKQKSLPDILAKYSYEFIGENTEGFFLFKRKE